MSLETAQKVIVLQRSRQFKGSKKSWPPQNVPRKGSKSYCPAKKNFVPQFLKQRDINSYTFTYLFSLFLLNFFSFNSIFVEWSPVPGTTAAYSCTQRPTTSSTRSRTGTTGSSGRWTCPSTSPGSRAARSSAWTGTASPGFSTSIPPSSASSSLLSTGQLASFSNWVLSYFFTASGVKKFFM